MKTLILSAGHNPRKSGASWQGEREHDHAMKWVNEIVDYLTQKQVNVIQIATGSLRKKVEHVNQRVNIDPSCIAVELHFNSAGTNYVQGNETLYYPNSSAGKQLATTFNIKFMELAQQWVVKDRGVKAGWYRMDRPGITDFYGDEDGDEMPNYWLRKTKCPSLILEPCFMCQLPEIGENWKQAAHAVAKALLESLQ